MFNNLFKIFRTLYYLKFSQIIFRFLNKLNKPTSETDLNEKYNLNHFYSLESYESYNKKQFSFLNLDEEFIDAIDWCYSKHGMLWVFNLNYFEYLNQSNIKTEEASKIINDYIDKFRLNYIGKHPYTISLRVINFIKFITKHNIIDSKITNHLYENVLRLNNKIEYHLLGNHVLENAFALWFAGHYFENEKIQKKSITLLRKELSRQILTDGAHFELSPMYHCILLGRLLECISLSKSNPQNWQQKSVDFLISKASIMLGWLNQILGEDFKIPLVNDSAYKIAPSPKALFDLASKLNIKLRESKLIDSGYRNIKLKKYSFLIDVANVKASYQPGHTHADTFNTLLSHNGKPILVEGGTSTYNNNVRRAWERSTEAHNTVTINNKNSSEVWSSFRLGRRAKIINLIEKDYYFKSTHDGYKHLGALHTRIWKWNENQLNIEDHVITKKKLNSIAHYHFHPNCSINLNNQRVYVNDNCVINFFGDYKVEKDIYYYAEEFNLLKKATKIKVQFIGDLKTSITF